MTASKRLLVVVVSLAVALCLAPQMAFGADSGSDRALKTGAASSASVGTAEAVATAQPVVSYKVYSKGKGWTKGWKKSGKTAGKASARIQVAKIKVKNDGVPGGISYRVKMYKKTWSKWAKNGKQAGKKGTAMMGIQIKLTGQLAKRYDVMYRVFHDEQGWLPWVANGRTAGCYGSLGINQLQVKLVEKGTLPSLKSGVYVISSAKNYKNALSIPEEKLSNGAKLVKGKYAQGAVNERFYVWNEGDGTFSLQSIASGKFVREANGVITQGADTGDASSRWVLQSWNGGYVVANAASGRKLAFSGTSAVAGSSNARWMFSKVNLIGNGVYTVVNSARGNVLDIDEMSSANHVNALLLGEGDDEEGAQAFSFTHKGSETYRIDCEGTYKTLEVAGGSKKNGANVRQATWKSANAQKWTAKFSRDNGLQFENRASGKVLTAVSGGKSGANVVSSANTSAATQKWMLKPSDYEGNLGVIRAVEKANSISSDTKYLIMVDLTNHWLSIFKGKRGNWTLYKDWEVTNGKASSPTVVGYFTVGDRGYSFSGDGHTCYYWTQFYGNYLFHSILYHEGTHKVMDGRLGRALSMGCVRMSLGNAKWIYNNIPSGTRVRTFR